MRAPKTLPCRPKVSLQLPDDQKRSVGQCVGWKASPHSLCLIFIPQPFSLLLRSSPFSLLVPASSQPRERWTNQSLDAEMHSRPVNHRPLAPEVKVYSREATLLRRKKKKKALFIYYFLRPCPKDASQQRQPLFSEPLQSVSQHLPLLRVSPNSVPVLLIGFFPHAVGLDNN